MTDNLYWDVLDRRRMEVLPILKQFKDEFYLAGGTALALQIGHRDSLDFDFFSPDSFSIDDLYRRVEKLFTGRSVIKTQGEKDTLSTTINPGIRVSFMKYPYGLSGKLVDSKYIQLASIEDIGCMKLSAITSRSVLKDYVDLYFILQHIDLSCLIGLVKEKLPTLDINLILKSLVYFEDLQEEPIAFKHGNDIEFEQVKLFLSNAVKKYLTEEIS